jgi:hypothetical protein
MDTNLHPREPKGQPTGGQFASKANPEAEIELGVEPQPTKTVLSDGNEEWRLNGQLHRDDGPAVTWEDGSEEWYQHGQLHRDDGPAVTYPDGTEVWWQHDRLHRDGGPAVTGEDGSEEWWQHGQLHRDGGPAVTRPDGTEEWYQHGQKIDPPTSTEPASDRILSMDQILDIKDHIARHTEYGPDYNRGVAEALRDAQLFADRGQMDSASHYAQLAMCRAGRISWEEFVDRDPYELQRQEVRRINEIDRAASNADVGDPVDWEVARALPSYTEVEAEFAVMPGRKFRLMARDLPQGPGGPERRFTNLTTGSEVFVPPDGLVSTSGGEEAGQPMFLRMVVTKRAR